MPATSATSLCQVVDKEKHLSAMSAAYVHDLDDQKQWIIIYFPTIATLLTKTIIIYLEWKCFGLVPRSCHYWTVFKKYCLSLYLQQDGFEAIILVAIPTVFWNFKISTPFVDTKLDLMFREYVHLMVKVT